MAAECWTEEARSLAGLLDEAACYRAGRQFAELLAFVVKMRRFGPYNALLLHRQKPGLSYAASAQEWRMQWWRVVKEEARPLVILVPFGPVGFVYDLQDTTALPDAPELPRGAFAFPASGTFTDAALNAVLAAVRAAGIRLVEVDSGDLHAGCLKRAGAAYTIQINRNHPCETRLTTVAHELGHLFLGHLGEDTKRRIPDRRCVSEPVMEVEAESVAFIVCRRQGVRPDSAPYLANFIKANRPVSQALDVERVMRAAGAAESAMGLAPRSYEHREEERRRR